MEQRRADETSDGGPHRERRECSDRKVRTYIHTLVAEMGWMVQYMPSHLQYTIYVVQDVAQYVGPVGGSEGGTPHRSWEAKSALALEGG